MLLSGVCMKLNSPTTALKLSSDDVLEALGLERRRSRGQDLAVVLRAGFVSLSTQRQPEVVS